MDVRGGEMFWLARCPALPVEPSQALTGDESLPHCRPSPGPWFVYPYTSGVLEERRWGFVQYNVYVTAALTDVITLQEYCATLPDGPAGLEEVVRLVAAYLRRMHDSGLWHRDMVTSNLLLTGAPGNRQVSLVDLNRARRIPYMPIVLRAMDLARMGWWERLPQLCALYSVGRFSATRLLWFVHLYGRWRTWRWHMRRVLKPLRARLRI